MTLVIIAGLFAGIGLVTYLATRLARLVTFLRRRRRPR